MKNLRLFLLVMAFFTLAAGVVYCFDDLPEGRMHITINGGDAYIETLDGMRYGLSPFTKENYSEITGILKTSGNDKAVIEMPSDQLYGFWLDFPEDRSGKSFSTEIMTEEWCIGISDFRNNTDKFDFLVTPKSTFMDNGPVNEKITLNANSDSLPDIMMEFFGSQGACKMALETGFDVGSADPSVRNLPSELVMTYYSVDGMVSVWAVSSDQETEEIFSGSAYQFVITLSCEGEDQNGREIESSRITMNENGIFFIDLYDFCSGGEAYFEGDLDGDDEYEIEPCGFNGMGIPK